MKNNFVYSTIVFLLVGCNYKSEKVDTIIHNGQVYSESGFNPRDQAIAIKNGMIVAIGAEQEILNKYDATSYIDAVKNYIYPGFYDAHCHFAGYAEGLNELDLVGAISFDEILNKVVAYQKKNQAKFIVGRGWDQNDWEIKKFPTKKELDSLFPEIPVYLERIDGHAALVNEAMLQLSSIRKHEKILKNYMIKNGNQLSGILLDNAMDSISKYLKAADSITMERMLAKAEKNCFEKGITNICEAGISVNQANFLIELSKKNKLKMEMYIMLNPNAETKSFLKNGPVKTDKINIRSIKLYGDGALGSRGAALKAPYSDDAKNYGTILQPVSFYNEYAEFCLKNGIQLNTHCIGDSANGLFLNIYKKYLPPSNDLRWRIEHAQVVDKNDISIFKESNIIPSVQPTHATSDMPWVLDRLGTERIKTAYAYKDLKNQLGIIALGTDFPVEEIDPLQTFYAAVYRKNSSGYPPAGFQMENALSRKDALNGMTIWAAIGCFEEQKRGSLEVGKEANIVIMDTDILKCKESLILKTKVKSTFIKGEKVF
jgi:predicted amidohydrolase YtcJ